MALQVQKVRAAYHQVADELRDRIFVGELPPGEKLPNEEELGSVFGVGRSTVREGLRVLESERLVRTVRGPQGGTFVTSPDPAQVVDKLVGAVGRLTMTPLLSLADLHEARLLLEPRAARLAAERADPEVIETLQAAAAAPLEESDVTGRRERSFDFHKLVLAATGNVAFVLMEQPILEVLRASGPRIQDQEKLDEVRACHIRIADAIAQHDPAKAEALMTEHVGESNPAWDTQNGC